MAARHNRDALGAKGSLSCREQLLAQRVKQVGTLAHGQLVLNKLEEVKIFGCVQLITLL